MAKTVISRTRRGLRLGGRRIISPSGRNRVKDQDSIVAKLAEHKEIVKSINKLFDRDVQESRQAASSLTRSRQELLAKYENY